ncbi:helix-turn-helix domain-containing protein [Cryobacterium sp. 1639]|uniref:helix-turn-helix domain-containing protein n=1 Tax=Cryobacterium inferilacus TaxID=2866629 RepID=UPI00210830F6|nr:helix-turn-helix domain-containing protein [Cryobacterium sp. 1639]
MRRRIDADERSGVLVPSNLARFSAEWVEPAAGLSDVVETYWSVNWRLPPGEQVNQRIVDFPAITFSIEAGDVPAAFVVTTVRPRAWSRVIQGAGSVFAIRLRPAGLAVLSDLDPLRLAAEQEISPQVDGRLFELLRGIAAEPTTELRARAADERVREALREHPPAPAQGLANAAVRLLTASPQVRSGGAVAAELGTSERTLQRALRCTLGLGPNDVARRIRLQEVVRRLSESSASMAGIAADLGYVDQADLINEFRAVSGTTPGRYVRMVQAADAHLRDPPPGVARPAPGPGLPGGP